jgi:hypothetical protein
MSGHAASRPPADSQYVILTLLVILSAAKDLMLTTRSMSMRSFAALRMTSMMS